jgi:uncharacterized membrane-anchored protein YitT (DUF2179 family)
LERFSAASLRTVPLILLGTAVYAFGLHYFVIPNELMEGGLTGVSLILNYALGLPVSYTTLILNIPLFWLGWKTIGKYAMAFTVLGTVSISAFLRAMEVAIARGWIAPFRFEQDFILTALYAGITLGAGLGLVFRFGGTTGGTDIIARLLNKKKGWSIGQIILIIDAVVLCTSLLYIPKEKVLYTLVAVFVASRVIDFITQGAYSAKAFTIITDRGKEVAAAVTREMDRGVTLFPAVGGFSNKDKTVVYSVIARNETRKMKAVVRSVDPNAFMIVSDVQDVLGEGFRANES